MFFKRLALAVLFATTPLTAWAQPAPSWMAETSNWAEAQALIDNTRHPEFFENLSTATEVKLRHKASGLTCIYVAGAPNNSLVLYPGGLAPGDDVGCNADVGGIYMTLYATRYGPSLSLDEATRDAAEGIKGRFPDARPYSGPVVEPNLPAGVGRQTYVAFIVGQGDRSLYTHARLAKVGEWIFKQRLSVMEANMLGSEMMIGTARWTTALSTAVKNSG